MARDGHISRPQRWPFTLQPLKTGEGIRAWRSALNSKAFEPAKGHTKVVQDPARRPQLRHYLLAAWTVKSWGKSISYHTRNRSCYLNVRPAQRTGLTYKESAVCSEKRTRLLDFLQATRGFSRHFRLYVPILFQFFRCVFTH